MISVILTTSGTFNVLGVENNQFIIQGNLTVSQLRTLKKAVDKELKSFDAAATKRTAKQAR
jgi:hypothetical protein